MGRHYDRLPIEKFGAHLLASGDLDPIYIALYRLPVSTTHLYRWLIAYWCFYHAGAACWLSEFDGSAFWEAMMLAAVNEKPTPAPGVDRWPRGHERRHFRGANGVKAIESLQRRYGLNPAQMVDEILARPSGAALTLARVSDRVQEHVGFGPWIGFKVADMVDRVLGERVSFDDAAVFMFKDPEEAALKLWRLKAGLPETAQPKDKPAVLREVTSYLEREFAACIAPPARDRLINIQEVETILCKWKSHMNGHYPLNNDIDEITDGVRPWLGCSATARDFIVQLPKRMPLEALDAS